MFKCMIQSFLSEVGIENYFRKVTPLFLEGKSFMTFTLPTPYIYIYIYMCVCVCVCVCYADKTKFEIFVGVK